MRADLRQWLGHIGVSLAVALLVGLLAYLLARGVTGVLLFMQQQQFLREVSGAFQGGIESLPGGDLRAVRLRVQELDARNAQISLVIGLATAAAAVVVSYIWLERRSDRA